MGEKRESGGGQEGEVGGRERGMFSSFSPRFKREGGKKLATNSLA
jgi:hypothetical protein